MIHGAYITMGGREDNKMGQGELNMWNGMAVEEKYGDQKSPH